MLSDSSDDARFVTRTMTKGATTTRWETFFDARTRIAHFRSKRTHERTAHPMTPPRLISTEMSRVSRVSSRLHAGRP